MTKGLNGNQIRWVTYLVYILLSVITLITAFHAYQISTLPDKYVRLERYKSDVDQMIKQQERIADRIDKILNRHR